MSEASLVADLHWLTDPARAGRGSRSPEAQRTARWLADQLRASGYAPVLQPIPSVDGQSNVIVELGTRGPAVLVVAHYDHLGIADGAVYPGADDNASGVAVALAVARELRLHAGTNHVVFVFTGGEEIGLLGAKAYVAKPTIPLAEIRAVYNLDMVGRGLGGEVASVAAVGVADDPDVSDAASALAVEAGLTLLAVRPGWLQIVGEDRRSDDWIFRDAGVFAVHFSTGLNEDYHRPTDTEDKVSRPQLVRMAKFLRGLVERTR